MNKVLKVLLIIISTAFILTGIAYASIKINEKIKGQATITPTFTGEIGNTDMNSIWIGSFQIGWNELLNKIGGEVKFEEGSSKLAEELNKKVFTKDMISSDSYYVKVEKTTPKLKGIIINDINKKFKIQDLSILNKMNFQTTGESYTIYSMLSKEFEFINPFDKLGEAKFSDYQKSVEYFGINNASDKRLDSNVEVLFYNNKDDFSVKLNTKGNDEVILYKTKNVKSFNDFYQEILDKSSKYNGEKFFSENDELKIPYINVETAINYDELCGRFIKGTNGMYIANALQNVKFNLNEKGGNLTSEAGITSEYLSENEKTRYFYFNDNFVLLMKEKDKSMPYFALKIDDLTNLVQKN